MTVQQLLKERLKRLESIPSGFISAVEKSEKKIIADIISQLARLETAGGKILQSKENLNLVPSIKEAIKMSVVSSPYVKAVTAFAKEFDTQAELTDKYLKKEFDAETSAFADEVLALMKKRTINALIGTPMDVNFILPIENILYDSISAGASIVDTIQAIRDFIEK